MALTANKRTVEELVSTIKLIKSADFVVEDVNVDLHKLVAVKLPFVVQDLIAPEVT